MPTTASRSPDPSRPDGDPLLLVANHPNMVFDPLLVATAVARPVRFLAKAPLFRIPVVGAVLRSAGCLPVYRPKDDPSLTVQNEATFAAVTAALAGGAAVAIFPEGTSHDAPALAPLKTGAARLALGAAARGVPLAIVPVGLVMADRDRARSEALVVLGPPVAWDDLRGTPAGQRRCRRDLTDRITRALASVTVNLDEWADEPLVTTAEAIYAASRMRPIPTPPTACAASGAPPDGCGHSARPVTPGTRRSPPRSARTDAGSPSSASPPPISRSPPISRTRSAGPAAACRSSPPAAWRSSDCCSSPAR